jgi:hypothetical protein
VIWDSGSLHATRLDNILIRLDTHLSPYEMYHGETPTWIPFIKSFEEIAIVKHKINYKLNYIIGDYQAYLGPEYNQKGDTYNFWKPITKHVVKSRSAVFLQQTCAKFHKLDKTQIAKQVAIITDELNEIFDNDEDVTPVDDEGNNLPNQTENLDNDDYNEEEDFVIISSSYGKRDH